MPGCDVRTVDTLRLEPKFLELGLFRSLTLCRSFFVFEDSTCPRHGKPAYPNCVPRQFVRPDRRCEPAPCHYIPLSDARETVDSLCGIDTQEGLTEARRNWLTATIKRLGKKQIQAGNITSFEMSARPSTA